ncbi:MAG: metal-sulfur cluster assembly factor [Planctomycetota bacterium]|jgi:FeS assembly SUF system protein
MDESPADNLRAQATRSEVIEVLKTVRDPELPINIYDMGLIYAVDVSPDDVVTIRMTLTTPMCPVADVLPAEVETKVKAISGVKDAKVELVWDPPWSPDRMSEAARLEAGFF